MLFITAVLALAPLALVSSCGKNDTAAGADEERAVEVKMQPVYRGNIEETIPLTGDVRGEKEVKVFAKVPGKLVKKVKAEGDKLKANEVFALIDRDEAALDYSRAEVRAPISGILTMYYCDIGDAVFPSPGKAIAEVAQMDRVKVVAYLSEVDMGKVKTGQRAKVKSDAYPDKVFNGTVTSVATAANPMTRKIKTEVTVPNKGYMLRPGTFARLDIITGMKKNVLLIQSRAVSVNKNERYVFVDENGRAMMRPVVCGVTSGGITEILKGLKEGEKVVVEGNYGLIEGTKITANESS